MKKQMNKMQSGIILMMQVSKTDANMICCLCASAVAL